MSEGPLPWAGRRILIAICLETTQDPPLVRGVADTITAFMAAGADIVLMHDRGSQAALPPELLISGVELLITEDRGSLPLKERAGQLAREVVARGQASEFMAVAAFGLTLCRGIAGGQRLATKFWAFPDSYPDTLPRNVWADSKMLAALYAGARRVFVANEETRSLVEAVCVAAAGRTYLFPSYNDGTDLPAALKTIGSISSLVIPAECSREIFLALSSRRSAMLELAKSLDLVFDGSQSEWMAFQRDPETATASALPHLKISSHTSLGPQALGVLPPRGSAAVDRVHTTYRQRNIVPIPLEALLEILDTEDKSPEALRLRAERHQAPLVSNRKFSDALMAVTPQSKSPEPPIKVVMAGADFKFVGDLVEYLHSNPATELRVDLWANNSAPQPQKSRPFAEWADVIVCEFSAFNAIWYSKNLRPGQRLIVHLHGYELLQPWITQLNLDAVSRVVFASDFYRMKAVDEYGWPPEKCVVIPNSVDYGDLSRPKLLGSEFHLGLVGYVPILKRPDRALDLLEMLLEHDERFTLHLKGHPPWNYNWEWRRAGHQSAYRVFFNRVRSSSLRNHVSFEPFGPDVASWLRKIGWVLSPSYRETFHLAPVEGMASGALPLVWNRLGASEIFPSTNVFDSTEAMAEFVLGQVSQPQRLATSQQAAFEFAERYARSEVMQSWGELISTAPATSSSFGAQNADEAPDLGDAIESLKQAPSEDLLLTSVQTAWEQDHQSLAMTLLDDHVPLTAKATGSLKAWELWVRGVFQLSLAFDSVVSKHMPNGSVYQPDPTTILTVSSAYPVPRFVGLTSLDVTLEASPHIETGGKPAASAVSVPWPGGVRADGAAAYAAAAVAANARQAQAAVVLSTAETIPAHAAFVAARRTGVPFVLLADWPRLKDVLTSTRVADIDFPERSVLRRILANSDAVFPTDDETRRELILQGYAVLDEVSAASIQALTANTSPAARPTVVYLGDGTSVGGLQIVADVTVCDVASLPEALESVPDALLIEHGRQSHSVETPYTSAAQLREKDVQQAIAALLPGARILGTRSIFATSTDPATQPVTVPLARKVDVVATSQLASIASYFRLNPTSNSSAILWGGSQQSILHPQFDGEESPSVISSATWDDRAAGLAAGQPWVPRTSGPSEWMEGSRLSNSFNSLRYEAHGEPEDLNAALWEGAFEISQGHTAVDQAVLLLRSAGLEVDHPRGQVPSTTLLDPDVPACTMLATGEGIRASTPIDERLTSDLLTLHRLTGATEFDVRRPEGESVIVYDEGHHAAVRRHHRQATVPTETALSASTGVSLVLATYLGAQRLPRMLESIANQSLDPALIELVVVPNGPVDGTAEVVLDWHAKNPGVSLILTDQLAPGVAGARNLGIESATRDYITFIDDDDYLEHNYLQSMYLRAQRDVVVLGRLSDLDEDDGHFTSDTPTSRRVAELGSRVLPLYQRAGALGMNAAKLIPAHAAKGMAYDGSLRSGEDVAFMAQLLSRRRLYVTSAADMPESTYVRILRPNSISRREEDFDFLVSERLAVVALLQQESARAERRSDQNAIAYLTKSQLSFVSKYIAGASSHDLEAVAIEIERFELGQAEHLQPVAAAMRDRASRLETDPSGQGRVML